MTNQEVINLINFHPERAKNALEHAYHGKVFVVVTSYGRIDNYFKTRRGAEGYIKKQSYVSWYDDYSHEMVNAANGLSIVEIQASQIKDYKTDKKMWWNWFLDWLGTPHWADNIVHSAKCYGVTEELLTWIEETAKIVKETHGLPSLNKEEMKQEQAIQETISEQTEQQEVTNNSNISIVLNNELNGIEIRFPEKPSQEIIEQLKENGFRWSKRGFWYAKQSEKTLAFANNLNDTQKQVNGKVINYLEYKENKNKQEEKEMSSTTTFEDILSKFDNVQIENYNRIDAEDQAFCEHQEKLYQQAIDLLNNTLEQMKTIYSTYKKISSYETDGYIDEYKDIKHLEERLNKIKQSHINKICRYFEEKHSITISESEIYDKYKDREINYNNILDEIFLQLRGFSFTEKAENEVKENFKKCLSRYDKIEVKGNKVTINGFVYVDYFDKRWGKIRMSYNSRDKVYSLCKALSLFETKRTDITNYYNSILYSVREEDPFRKYELGYNKVVSIRFFQNGKTEIVFKTSEQAQQFTREYCGITNVA